MANALLHLTMLFIYQISHSAPVTQRTDIVEIHPQNLQLGFTDQDPRKPHHFVAPPSNVATVAPLVLETHRIVPNNLFSLATGYRAESPNPTFPAFTPTHDLQTLTSAVRANPVVTALLLSTLLGTRQMPLGHNSPEHSPPDPFLALLLSHYGRYLPRPGHYNGLYGYNAANNIHNTRPFGSYKIYDDSS